METKSCGILEAMNVDLESNEMDVAYESVLNAAMEAVAHTIPNDVRKALPDSAFGIPSERKYPLVVKGDPALTEQLVTKAVQMFHFCKPEWKAELAKNILKVIVRQNINIKISQKSQINKYVKIPEKYLLAAKPEDK